MGSPPNVPDVAFQLLETNCCTSNKKLPAESVGGIAVFLSHRTRKCSFDRIIITCSQDQQKGFPAPMKLLCSHAVAFLRVLSLSLSLFVSSLWAEMGTRSSDSRSHCCRCSVSHLWECQSCLCISTVTAAACRHSTHAGAAPSCRMS